MSILSVRKIILPILRKHHIRKAGLFGSLVRGQLKKQSDIDVLVDIKSNISLLDFIGIKQELEQALKRKVDLVEYAAIKPILRQRILNEQVVIL